MTPKQIQAHLDILIRNHEAGIRTGSPDAAWLAATEAEIVATIAKIAAAR